MLGIDLSLKKSVVLVNFKGLEKKKKEIELYDADIRRILTADPNSLVINKKGIYVIIIAHRQEQEIKEISKRIYTDLKEFLKCKFSKQTPEVYVCIGDAVQSLKDINKSKQQAKQILNILPKLREKIGYYPELGIWTLLTYVATNTEISQPYVQYYLNEINQMKDAAVLKETLESYLNHNGQINKASEQLFIHPNTLKYRINKIEDYTGYDLSDAETRLNLNLALRLEKMLKA